MGDNLPFGGLMVFESSVGKPTLSMLHFDPFNPVLCTKLCAKLTVIALPCKFNLVAFKSHSWKAAPDDDVVSCWNS